MDFKAELGFLRRIIYFLTDTKYSLSEKMQASLVLILEKIKARQGSIMLKTRKKNKAKIVASTNPKILNLEVDIDPETISGHVFTTGESVYFKDVKRSVRFKDKIRKGSYDTSSLMCVPLQGKWGVVGVINVSDHKEQNFFYQSDFNLLKDYASLLSPLIENSCLFHQLEEEKEKLESLSERLKLKQKELELTYTERSELVQMVVHDFKSPLAAIISNLDLLKYIGLSEEMKPVVETALKGAQELLTMIDEFLQVARLDDWKNKKVKLGPVALKPIVERIVEELSPLAREKEIKVSLLSQEDVLLFAEENLLQHLIQNLFSNALKYTPAQGEVKISWEVRQSRRKSDRFPFFLIFCVQDTGPGVPDELKQKIFDRFQRLQRDKKIEGTGIGLFICNRIVNILEGKIWVEDAKPRGSKFCFTCYVTGEENAG